MLVLFILTNLFIASANGLPFLYDMPVVQAEEVAAPVLPTVLQEQDPQIRTYQSSSDPQRVVVVQDVPSPQQTAQQVTGGVQPPPSFVFNIMSPTAAFSTADQPQPAQQPTMATVTCQGARYLIDSETAKYYACCGSSIFHWPTQQCGSSGQAASPIVTQQQAGPVYVVALPPTTQAPAVTKPQEQLNAYLTCNGVKFAFKTVAQMQNYACCGKSIYDVRSSTCNETTMPSMPSLPNFSRLFNFQSIFPFQQQQQQQQQQMIQPTMQQVFSQQPVVVAPPAQSQTIVSLPQAEPAVAVFQPVQQQQVSQYVIPNSNNAASCTTIYTCCTGFKAVYDPERRYRCCPGAGPYDPTVSSCVPAAQ